MHPELCRRIHDALATAPIHDPLGYGALARVKLPGPDYYSVLRLLHRALRPKLYVEIGIRDGTSLALAAPGTRCIAIDPEPKIATVAGNVSLQLTNSDDFFAQQQCRDQIQGFDLAFIDGDHSFAQALRDFAGLEAAAGPRSVVALHDVIPMDERTASPTRNSNFWTGDVWRLMAAIVTGRPDLVAFTIACPPTGLGIVGRFGPGRRKISEETVARMTAMPFDPDWERQHAMLNFVENTGPAIDAAFQRITA